jgi:hypothetical protein
MWDVTSCSLDEEYRYFGGNFCLHFQDERLLFWRYRQEAQCANYTLNMCSFFPHVDYIVACRPFPKWRLCEQSPLLGNGFLNEPMDWLESDVFCAVRADGCARKNRYGNRGRLFSVRSVSIYYKQHKWWGQCSWVQWSEVKWDGEFVC